MTSNCVFCKIIAKQIPASIIAENDAAIVIKDIAPKFPIHYLIIPKNHVADLTACSHDQLTHISSLFSLAQQIARDANIQDFRLLINNGAGVGQSVFHLHMHFLAGKQISDF